MVRKRTRASNIIRQDKPQAAENDSPPPVSASRLKAGNLEIIYYILPADIRRNFRHSLSRSRNKGLLLLSLLSIVPLFMVLSVVWDAWSRNSLNVFTVVIIIAIFAPFVLVVTLLSMNTLEQFYPKGASAPISKTEITPALLRFDKRRILDEDNLVLEPVEAAWVDVSGIYWHEGDIVFLCSGRIPNNFIPKTAFANSQEAELFYNTARHHWEAVKCDIAGAGQHKAVWPPAPRSSNSAEPGNSPQC